MWLLELLLLLVLLLVLLRLLLPVLRRVFTGQRIDGPPNCITISCPGGGVFFWWQIGAMHELLQLYDLPLESVMLSGASAGALAVVLAQCGVDPAAAHKLAFSLADEAGCMQSPLGLCGKWGRLVYAWLDALLPAHGHTLCNGRCNVVVTRCTPLPRACGIAAHNSRAELIDALMASTHVPFFMDGSPFSRRMRGTTDGDLLTWLGLASALETLCPEAANRPAAILVSHKHDEAFLTACRANGWSSLSTRGTEEFCEYGAAWVRREASLGAAGLFAALAPYRRTGRKKRAVSPAASATRQRRAQRSPARV